MTSEIIEWMFALRRRIVFAPGRVLEIGSRDVTLDLNGSPRPLFPDATEYIGIDQEAGHGVDKVMDARNIYDVFGVDAFDTVICCEMLEHDRSYSWTIEQINNVLKKAGYLIITTPTFGFPLHRFPKDYWRFGEDAFREVFFAGFEILNLVHLDDALIPAKAVTIAAIGRKL